MSQRRLHVVTGKGGVGKSTVAAAIALAAARRGARVLAIEVPRCAGLSRILGVEPQQPGTEARTREGIAVAYFDGAAALAEYLSRFAWLRPMREAVLGHPLYRAFVAAAPGVQELMVIGKVRDELRRRDGRALRWDVVVLDAGASGHGLQLLRMSAAAAGAFQSGLVHRESSRIDALLRDPEVCAVHVVATPEHMPLREAAEVIRTVRDERHMPIGALFVNQCRPPAPDGVDALVERLAARRVPRADAPVRDAVVAAVRRGRGWERIQEAEIAAVEDAARLRSTRLPRLVGGDGARARAQELAAYVAEAAL